MISLVENALFLGAEKREFKNDKGDTIEFYVIKILDEQNNLITCAKRRDVQLDLPVPRSEVTAEIEFYETYDGKVKKYLNNIY